MTQCTEFISAQYSKKNLTAVSFLVIISYCVSGPLKRRIQAGVNGAAASLNDYDLTRGAGL